ncbi:hypothetical protein KCU98_g147, partial [Aureobasidium melanogenum]
MALSLVSTMTLVVDFSKSLPPIILWDRGGRACQIQGIVVIASSIANVIHRISLAGVDMICRESKAAGSEFLRSFYKGSAEAGFDVELNVAVEEPDTYLSLILKHESVSSDRRGCVQVVDDHFDNFAILEHVRVDISIHLGVRRFGLVDGCIFTFG